MNTNVATDGGRDRHDEAPVEWRAGSATAVLTPETSMWMAGFGARDEPSEGVEQDLHARALVLEDRNGTRAAIVSVELLGVPDDVRDAVYRRCRDDYGLDPDEVLLSATHTHCGPLFDDRSLERYGVATEERLEQAAVYRSRLEDELVAVIGDALGALEPAVVSRGASRCGIATNRRLPVEDGIAHVPNPDGPVDHDLPVLAVETPSDATYADRGDWSSDDGADEDASSLRAIVFGYACHPTVMVNYMKFDGDWPGYACAHLEERYPNATALFLQGCAGDQNAYPRRTLELAKRHGRTAGTAVEAAIDAVRVPLSGPLRTAATEQTLAFEAPPSREELERMRQSDDRNERFRARTLLDELDETGAISTEYQYPIKAIGFGGDLTLLALQGEALVEYGLQLKESFDGPLWTTAYSNGSFTYVPTADAIVEGGYEGRRTAQREYPGLFEADVEERILRASRTLAARVGAR